MESPAPAIGLLDDERARAFLGGVSPKSMFNWRREGKLRAVKLGKRVLYDVRDLQAFINANKEPTQATAL